ncbi:MAG: hypothetical protein M3R08_01135 [Bacteroidota bacterium]|nr:hypothetical protein [Bacteroidota bacterium]
MLRKAIIIKPVDKAEEQFLRELFKLMGSNARSLNAEMIEEVGLSIMMSKVDRTMKVSKATVMRKLRS